MNSIRQVRNIIYALKRKFGFRVDILTTESITQDLQTGMIVRNERLIVIRKAVVVTSKEIRDFTYDLSFIASNKNFTYGGLFDTSERVMIIGKRDLPKDYVPAINDRCV